MGCQTNVRNGQAGAGHKIENEAVMRASDPAVLDLSAGDLKAEMRAEIIEAADQALDPAEKNGPACNHKRCHTTIRNRIEPGHEKPGLVLRLLKRTGESDARRRGRKRRRRGFA